MFFALLVLTILTECDFFKATSQRKGEAGRGGYEQNIFKVTLYLFRGRSGRVLMKMGRAGQGVGAKYEQGHFYGNIVPFLRGGVGVFPKRWAYM